MTTIRHINTRIGFLSRKYDLKYVPFKKTYLILKSI
ncbi:hypothetical protein J2X17_000521 [Flavobacterium aquidurense]|nr:hypothetical protein [Flavobacterium aquidurense]